ncbi:unnamed protein product [Closterium sp. NIES-54]
MAVLTAPPNSLPYVVALNCMEGCHAQAEALADLCVLENVGLSEGMLDKLERADVVLVHSLHYLPRAAQRKLSASQLILCLGSSADTRPVESSLAEELGLRLVHVDVPRTDEVADSVMALMLGLLRRTHVLAAQGCTSASWFAGFKGAWQGMRRLRGMVLGLVGANAAARAVARRAAVFGMRVVFCDPEGELQRSPRAAALMRAVGAERSTVEAVLAASDVVSLHVALTDSTLHLINDDTAKHFKKGAMLINASSCHLVSDSAIKRALNSGRLGSCALDGIEGNQWLEAWGNQWLEARVREFPNVLILPRSADYSQEVWEALQSKAVAVVRAFLTSGKVPEELVLDDSFGGVEGEEEEEEEESQWQALHALFPASSAARGGAAGVSGAGGAANGGDGGGGTGGKKAGRGGGGRAEEGRRSGGDGSKSASSGGKKQGGERRGDTQTDALTASVEKHLPDCPLQDGMLVALQPLASTSSSASSSSSSLSLPAAFAAAFPKALFAAKRRDGGASWRFAPVEGISTQHPSVQFVIVCDKVGGWVVVGNKDLLGCRSVFAGGKFLQATEGGELLLVNDDLNLAESWFFTPAPPLPIPCHTPCPPRVSQDLLGCRSVFAGGKFLQATEGGELLLLNDDLDLAESWFFTALPHPSNGLALSLTNALHSHVELQVLVHADTEAGTAEDVFPEGAPSGDDDDDDGVEYWSRDGLPEKLPIPTYPPHNRKRPHPSSQNRDSRPPSPRHKPNDHKRQAYTAAEKLKWVAQLDVAVSVRALARESGIHRKCLANWKRAADFLKEAHSARWRMHSRGGASWYRLMEIKVYERLLDWQRKGTAVSVGRLQEWSWEFMKILYPLVKWKGSQRWSDQFHVAEQCKKFWQFFHDKRRERGIETTWIINADQTPLWLEMPATTTVDQTGARSVPIRSAGYQKERVTVMLACTADGMKLRPWVFFKRKTVLKGVFPPVPADLIKRAFLTCGISNALDGSEDGLAMAHRRSQLTAEVDVDYSIIADGFFGNNCEEPESDEDE